LYYRVKIWCRDGNLWLYPTSYLHRWGGEERFAEKFDTKESARGAACWGIKETTYWTYQMTIVDPEGKEVSYND